MPDPIAPADLLDLLPATAELLLFLDYDGTLVHFTVNPEDARPTERAHRLFAALSNAARLRVVIISGRTRNFLQENLGLYPLDLGAEYGQLFRPCSSSAWELVTHPDNAAALANFAPLLESFCEQVPGSLIEQKEFGLAWHYRGASETSAPLISELAREIEVRLPKELKLVKGNMVYEISTVFGGKAQFVDWYLATRSDTQSTPFVFSIGDDRVDEEMFALIQQRKGIGIKVGEGSSCAKFRLRSPNEVLEFLEELCEVGRTKS